MKPRQIPRHLRQKAPTGVAVTYTRILRRAVVARQKILMGDILDKWEHRRTGGRLDAARRIGPIKIQVEPRDLQAIAARVAKKNAAELNRVMGVPSTSLGLGAKLEHWREKNTDLITSMGDTEIDRLDQILENAERSALRVETLREQIQHEFGVTKSKADLIARDQVLKLNGDLTQYRQQAAGIDRYIWSGSDDERERPTHVELNDTVQRWDDPPVTNDQGDTNHPGGDYQCRCVAIPFIEGFDTEPE